MNLRPFTFFIGGLAMAAAGIALLALGLRAVAPSVVPEILPPGLAAAVTAPADTPAVPDGLLAPHKALYIFRMSDVTSGASVTGIRGRMYFAQEDACDAWTTDHRFTVEYQYAERAPLLNASQYTAWEAKSGEAFYFSSDRSENGMLSEQLRGAVMRAADGTAKAAYTQPEGLSFDMPAGYFLPMSHTADIIRRAQAGETFFSAPFFDGTDADGPLSVNIFIGPVLDATQIAAFIPADAETLKADTAPLAEGTAMPVETFDAGLLSPRAWKIRMAVFPLSEREEMAPLYEMDMVLHDNGVVSHVIVDYTLFKVEQRLAALEKLPAPACGN